jgi:pimeloyl-ACP methyl ester carboxylesterase
MTQRGEPGVDAAETGLQRDRRPDAPGGDYPLGTTATELRDLLVALGHHSATIVGHSLGGGIAPQFACQFPESVNRLALISSGGLGPQRTPALRAATLPGAATVVAGMALVPGDHRAVPVHRGDHDF